MQNYSQASLLIVDDLASDQQLIKYALEEVGYNGELDFLKSGQAVVDRFFSNPSNEAPPLPDLILLDLSLSDMEGQHLLDRLKNHPHTFSVPVIIFSSLESITATELCYSLGAGGFVRKPTDFDDLKTCLKGIIEFWLQPFVMRGRHARGMRFTS